MEHVKKLLVFDTHPIQYRSPVFRELKQKNNSVKVYYFNADFNGDKWWFQEVGTAKALNWGVDLLSGFESEMIGTESLGFFTLFRKFAGILKFEKPDAVLTYGYYLREHWVLWLLCQLYRIKLSFVGESFQPQDLGFKAQFKQKLREIFFQGVSAFITIGKKTEAYYLALKIPRNKIFPAKYCVSTDFFESARPQASELRAKFRAQYDIPENAFVLLFVGRLFERKRPEDVISLHRKLYQSLPLYTIMVGTGPMEAELKSTYKDLKNFRIVGFQNQEEIRSWYYSADLLFVPSEFETWGLVVNEAFACGLPALVTDQCGVSEDLVIGNETGYVYPVGDLDEAATFIKSFSAQAELRYKLSSNARSKVLREYHPGQFADAILKGIS